VTSPFQRPLTSAEFSPFAAGVNGTLSLTANVTKVPILGCYQQDWVDFPKGNIALVLRGNCTFIENLRLQSIQMRLLYWYLTMD